MSRYNERLGIWLPGVALLRRMHFPTKLGLIGSIVMIPLLVVAFFLVQRQNADLDFTQTEVSGLSLLRPTLRVVALVQQHRGLTQRLLLGDAASRAELDKTRSDLGTAIKDTQTALTLANLPSLNSAWSDLAQRLSALPAATQQASAAASFTLHTDLVRDLRYFVYSVGEFSGLLYEPQASAYLLMDAVVSRSAEQSAGIREISLAIKQLDEITQSNAQMVERAVNQSGALEVRGESLSHAIRSFKLQQGVAEEAMALVQRASEYRERCGSRDAFLRGINDPSNQFFDRDMYVFALDHQGAYMAFAGNSAKVGTRVHDVPGVNGQALVDDMFEQLAFEPGWVEYDITNPISGQVQSKLSFVMAVDDLAVGCGVYKDLVVS
jgi:hypothetical protein